MPIQVTCPGCDYHFLVGDEFAGRPGRCPECGNVIHVPEAATDSIPPEPHAEPHAEPHPYGSPHSAEPFEEFPRESRRRHEEAELYHDQRDDYDDRPLERVFDHHARAAKWQSVSNGLRNLMVAVVILAIDEIVRSAFALVDGVQPGQGNNFNAKDWALIIGNALVLCIALALWAMGRIGCGRVPYVPARRIARPAGVIAGMTAVSGIMGLGGVVGGIMIMMQNQGAGAGLFCLGACTFFPAVLGFIVAEVMGLISQIRIATGLKDRAFLQASRAMLAVALLLTALFIVAVFAFFVFMMVETDKAVKNQQQAAVQQQQPANGDKKNDNAPIRPNGKAKGKNAPPAAPANPPAGQQGQPPPPVDLADHPSVIYGIVLGQLAATLIYAVIAVMCFQLGRAAIRREIAHLVGDPHDRDHWHDGQY